MNRIESIGTTRHGPRGRRAAFGVLAAAWGILAVFALTGFAENAAAGSGGRHDTAKNSIGNIRAKVVTGTQAAAASSGSIQVNLRANRGEMPNRISVNLTVARTASSGSVRSGSLTVRPKGRRALGVRVRMNAAGRDILRDCADPTVRVKVTVNGRSKVVRRQLQPQAALCAVPQGVDLDRGDACEFIADPANPCLGTYPNNFFTRRDRNSATGLRLALGSDSTPANKPTPGNPKGRHIAVEVLNQSDGFSAGPLLQVKIPGLDSQAAFSASGLVGEADMSRAWDAGQPAVLIDAVTGERQLIWTELDSTATSNADRMLIIRVGKNLVNGHRYIVALRNLKNAAGKTLRAPAGFRLYRDSDLTSNRLVESRRAGFEKVFRKLGKAGVARKSLYLAWDFTVASTENVTGRMLSIRNRAFHELGDDNLTDGIVQGQAPQFTIDEVQTQSYEGQNPPAGDGVEDIRKVIGTFQVPCYLNQPGCPPGSTFTLDENRMPVRTPGNFMTARFKCNIPRSAVVKVDTDEDDVPDTWTVDHQVRPSLYGHGLFGSINEVSSTNIRQLGTEQGVMTCGTDWSGMASEDVVNAMRALMDLSDFPALPDRLQQGFLNFLYLGRLMIHPDGFASNPHFRFDGESVIDTSDLFYYGNSQGGIAGGALTSVATDFTRSVLYVPAMNYSTMLSRSVDFDMYKSILYPYYPREIERPLIFSLMQTMWDRGEPNGYANHMTSDPLPGTPAHKVLIMMAYGDHQVANVATEVEARTIGAPLRHPVVSEDRLAPGLIKPWVDHETLGDLNGPAADGSGFVVWDIGPKRIDGGELYGTDPAPLGNIPPTTTGTGDPFDSGSGIDPHDTVIRSSPLAREQIAEFIKTNGKITNPCGADPCWAAGWQGMP